MPVVGSVFRNSIFEVCSAAVPPTTLWSAPWSTMPPFDCCDREQGHATAWQEFEAPLRNRNVADTRAPPRWTRAGGEDTPEPPRPLTPGDCAATSRDEIMTAPPKVPLNDLDLCHPGLAKAIAYSFTGGARASRFAELRSIRLACTPTASLCGCSERVVAGLGLIVTLLSPSRLLRQASSPADRPGGGIAIAGYGGSSRVRS